jgi:two-component system phosphate regulon response regulator PhoB
MSSTKAELLIVEDEPEIAELIEFHAERAGMRPRKVHSGRIALDVVKREKPDVIVLDLMLPDVDGLEVCRRLKQDEATRSIPIVMVTAKGEEADVVAGIELGAHDYVTKPFSPRVLMARLRNILRRTNPIDEPSPKSDRMVLLAGRLVIDLDRHEVAVEEEIGRAHV